MNTKCTKNLKQIVLAFVAVAMIASSSFAMDYYLCVGTTTVDMPGSPGIPMWGFALDDDNDLSNGCGNPVQVPGPRLTVSPGDTSLVINLRNDLPGPGSDVLPTQVSIVIPGQDMPALSAPVYNSAVPPRVRSFTHEAVPGGGTATYTWSNFKPGTFLYHSGTHPQIQVQMGLYGAVSKDFAEGQAYDSVPYDEQLDVLYSEIDPALHAAVANGTYGTTGPTSTLDYKPKYFLINGEPYISSTPPDPPPPCTLSFETGERLLLRMMNAGLREFAPMMIGAHFQVVAEGGNKYQFPYTQYSLLLQPGSTKDLVFTPSRSGKYSIIDRRLNLTNNTETGGGMQLCLMVSGDVSNLPPAFTSTPVTIGSVGVPYSYDVDATDPDAGDTLTFSLDLSPSGMTIDPTTGVIAWTPQAYQTGNQNVTVRVTDNGSPVEFAIQSFTIIVTGNPPNITSAAVTIGEVGVQYNYTVTAIDPDLGFGEILTFSLDAAPTGMTIHPMTGQILWTPQANQTGTGGNNVIVRVIDLGGLNAFQAFTIDVTGHPPTITSTAGTTATVGGLYTYDVNANDPDGPFGEVLTFSLDAFPTGMTINSSTGVIQWIPTVSQLGDNGVTVRVTDLEENFNTQTFTITVSLPAAQLYFSTLGNTTVPGATAPYDDADIYSWNGINFARVFDASAIPLSGDADIDALQVSGPNQIYMSFTDNIVVPGAGTIQDEDIVFYNGSTWSLYFDGSDVGLTTGNEDVDAFEILTDGSVVVSITGTGSVPGVAAVDDEDLIRCVGSFGPTTTCTWSVYFDGSDVALTSGSEDIDGAAFASGNIYLSTIGNFAVTGLTGGGDDVFACLTPVIGINTSCSAFSLYFNGSAQGVTDNLDAIDVP